MPHVWSKLPYILAHGDEMWPNLKVLREYDQEGNFEGEFNLTWNTWKFSKLGEANKKYRENEGILSMQTFYLN